MYSVIMSTRAASRSFVMPAEDWDEAVQFVEVLRTMAQTLHEEYEQPVIADWLDELGSLEVLPDPGSRVPYCCKALDEEGDVISYVRVAITKGFFMMKPSIRHLFDEDGATMLNLG